MESEIKFKNTQAFITASYSMAWHEVNTRIAQRQNTITIFTTLMMGIVAAIAASEHGSPGDNDFSGLVFFIPIVSGVFAFLNIKHEKTIQLLRSFLAQCEKAHSDMEFGYNSKEQWVYSALKYREKHDYACIALVILSNTAALWVLYTKHPEMFSYNSVIMWITISVGLWSAVAIWRAGKTNQLAS